MNETAPVEKQEIDRLRWQGDAQIHILKEIRDLLKRIAAHYDAEEDRRVEDVRQGRL
jgi:hypothetical protein